MKEAYKYPMDKNANTTAESIPWLDKELIQRGVDVFNKNYFGIYLASFYSGIELFSIKSVASVLLSTGTVKTREKSMTRILRTALHFKSWATAGTSIFDPSSEAYRAIHSVRFKHYAASHAVKNRTTVAVEYLDKKVLEPPYKTNWRELRQLAAAVRADLRFVNTSEAPMHLLNWDTTVSVGQFDLGLVQFILLSHVVMTPREFGIYAANHTDTPAFVHSSAVVGRILGIEDRFNIALNLPLDEYDRFYRNIVVASLKDIDETIVHAMDIVLKSISDEFVAPHTFRLKCWLYHCLKISVRGFEGKNILPLINWEDWSCLSMLTGLMGPINTNKMYEGVTGEAYQVWLKLKISQHQIKFP